MQISSHLYSRGENHLHISIAMSFSSSFQLHFFQVLEHPDRLLATAHKLEYSCISNHFFPSKQNVPSGALSEVLPTVKIPLYYYPSSLLPLSLAFSSKVAHVIGPGIFTAGHLPQRSGDVSTQTQTLVFTIASIQRQLECPLMDELINCHMPVDATGKRKENKELMLTA